MKFLVLAILVAAVSADVRDILNKNDAPYNYQQPQQSLAQPQAQAQQQPQLPQPEQNNVDATFNSLPEQKYSQQQFASDGQVNLQAGPTSLPSFTQGAQIAPAFLAQAQAPLAAQNAFVAQAHLPSQAPLATQASFVAHAPLQKYVAPQVASAQLSLPVGRTQLPSFAQNTFPAFSAQAQAQAPLAAAQAYNFDAQYNQYSLPLQYSQLPIQYQSAAYAFPAPAAYSAYPGAYASFPASAYASYPAAYPSAALQSFSGVPAPLPVSLSALASTALPQQQLSLQVAPTSLPSFGPTPIPSFGPTALPAFASSAEVLPEFNLAPEVQFKSEPVAAPQLPATQPIEYNAPEPTAAAPQLPIAPAPQPIVPQQPIAPPKPIAPKSFTYSDDEGYNYNKPQTPF